MSSCRRPPPQGAADTFHAVVEPLRLLAEQVTMTAYEYSARPTAPTSVSTLEDRFEILKEIGDGSFGSVAVARVRTAGANIARRGSMVGFIQEIGPSVADPIDR